MPRRAPFPFACASAACALAAGPLALASTVETVAGVVISERGGVDLEAQPWLPRADPAFSASLQISGGKDEILSLDIPTAFSLDRHGGGDGLRVSLSHSAGGGAVTTASGAMRLRLGGSVEADINQVAPGLYRGVLVIMDQYN